jgi:hypothetical protein
MITNSKIELPLLENASYMFNLCIGLEKVKDVDMTSIINAQSMFYKNIKLKEIYLKGEINNITNFSNIFYGLPYEGVFYAQEPEKYLAITTSLPEGWSIEEPYTPTTCTSLSISAEDVAGRQTQTYITWEAITNGINPETNEVINNKRAIETHERRNLWEK